MKGFGIEQKRSTTNDLLWKCLLDCGRALLVDSDNVLLCRNDDLPQPYSLLCEQLESCFSDITLNGLGNRQFSDLFTVFPLAGSEYVRSVLECSYDCELTFNNDDTILLDALEKYVPALVPQISEVFVSVSNAWKQFLQNEEIVQTRAYLTNTSIACPENNRRTEVLSESEEQFLKHVANKWAFQFSRICHIRKPHISEENYECLSASEETTHSYDKINGCRVKNAEVVFNEFQKCLLNRTRSALVYIDMLKPVPEVEKYRSNLAGFLLTRFHPPLNGVDLNADLEAFVNNDLSEDLKKLLEFCDDAAEKARVLSNAVFSTERWIMRLAVMRTMAILSAFSRPEFSPPRKCTQHLCHDSDYSEIEDIKKAKIELEAIRTLASQLSQAQLDYSSFEDSRLDRRVIVRGFSKQLQKFNPFDRCVECGLKDFVECRLKLEELSEQVAKKKCPLTSPITRLSFRLGEFEFFKNQLAQDEINVIKSGIRNRLIKLLPLEHLLRSADHPRPDGSESGGPMESRPLFERDQLFLLQHWILTKATKDQLYIVVKTLNPFLEHLWLGRIDEDCIKKAMKCRLLGDGSTFPEIVAYILTFCNLLTMTSILGAPIEREYWTQEILYCCLLIPGTLPDLIATLNNKPTIYGNETDVSLYERACRRFKFRATALEGNYSYLLKWLDWLKNARIKESVEEKVEELALELHFDRAAIEATNYFEMKHRKINREFNRRKQEINSMKRLGK